MSGCLSPDGGNSPEEVSANSARVNRESEVAASFHERDVRDEDEVNTGNSGTYLTLSQVIIIIRLSLTNTLRLT